MLRRWVMAGLGAALVLFGVSALARLALDPQAQSHVFWYINRATGFTAYLVLFANMVLGLMVKTKRYDAIAPRWRSFDLHQFTALLALGFLALHIFPLLFDSFAPFTLTQLFVPLASTYRPLWIAVGIISLYGLVVVTVTFYFRAQIGQRAWRAIHYVSFAAFFLVLLHGVFAGSDSQELWAKLTYWVTGVIVCMLTASRFLEVGGTAAAPSRAGRVVKD